MTKQRKEPERILITGGAGLAPYPEPVSSFR